MAGDDEGVPGEYGALVEERHDVGLIDDQMGWQFAGNDLIEHAPGHHRSLSPERAGARDDAGMADQSPVPLTTGLPETVLPPEPPEALAALDAALSRPVAERRNAVAAVAADRPTYLDAWARLAELAGDAVEAYAYARVGYHRGLDTLRAAGWRGSGYVRWRHETNQGFLRALDALRRAASAIGERAEEERCDVFLHQLDPDWDRRPPQ